MWAVWIGISLRVLSGSSSSATASDFTARYLIVLCNQLHFGRWSATMLLWKWTTHAPATTATAIRKSAGLSHAPFFSHAFIVRVLLRIGAPQRGTTLHRRSLRIGERIGGVNQDLEACRVGAGLGVGEVNPVGLCV